MMYKDQTTDDNAEIVHSEMKEDGTVKVYVEKTTLKDSLPYDMYTSFLSNKRRIGIYLKELNRNMDQLESHTLILEDNTLWYRKWIKQ